MIILTKGQEFILLAAPIQILFISGCFVSTSNFYLIKCLILYDLILIYSLAVGSNDVLCSPLTFILKRKGECKNGASVIDIFFGSFGELLVGSGDF